MTSNSFQDVTPVILTGGLGTRLRQVVVNTPKTMAPVAGRPFLEYILKQLQAAGFKKAVLCVGYLSEQVQNHFGARFGDLELAYSVEQALLGTAGAVRFAQAHVSTDHVLVMNGDSFCGQPLIPFVGDYLRAQPEACMAITEVDNTQRYGRVNVDENKIITSFEEKGSVSGSGWINAGIYLFQRISLMQIPPGRNSSLERQIFPGLCTQKKLRAFYAQQRPFIDIGTPESFAAADTLFINWETSLAPELSMKEVA